VKRLEIWTISALFAAMITIPVVIFAVGVRPEPNQNRPPTPLPELSVAGILDRDLTPQLDAYLEDAVIIAPGAAAAQAWTDVALGDSPSPKVTLGQSGWLYYTLSLNKPCIAPAEVDDFADRIARAERIVNATGRNLVVAIAPDKATIIPEFLPEDDDSCVAEVAQVLSELDEPQALLTIWDEMRRARANDRPIYFRLDTHWTHAGAAVMAEAIVETLAPGGWDPAAVRQVATVDHEGDLTVLLGLPSTEPTDELATVLTGTEQSEAVRALFTATGAEYEGARAVDFSTTGKPIVAGHTLVLHDSFGWSLTPMLSPYFESVAFIRDNDPGTIALHDDVVAASTIVDVVVQRSIQEVFFDKDLAAGFLSALADEFDSFAEGTKGNGDSLQLPPATTPDNDIYVIVELMAGNDGAEVVYGDFTAALSPDSPRSAFYVGEGGKMSFAGQVHYRLVSISH
jgi:hypothetical protein